MYEASLFSTPSPAFIVFRCFDDGHSDWYELIPHCRQGSRAFSRVSTGDSDIPSSFEMQDKPAFKSLQGNPALFRVRASQWPFHLRQHTQGFSHIPIAERSLSFGACGKLVFHLSWIQGISCHLELIWDTRSSFMLLQWPQGPSRLVTVFLATLWSSIKDVKAPLVLDEEQGIALHAMWGNQVSSRGEG